MPLDKLRHPADARPIARRCCMFVLLAMIACGPSEIQAERRPPPSSTEATAYPGQLVNLPGGRRLNLRCVGRGAPVVLLEGGFAATSLAWGQVQSGIARTHRVCSYDRAGYGFSDPGPFPRDGAAVARDLDRALRVAHIDGPYVLVGHSAGALYMRLFLNRRPQDVVGMVLVEPSIEHQDRRFAGMFGPNAGSLEGIRLRVTRCQAAAEGGLLPSEDPALIACVPKPSSGQSPRVVAARQAEALRPSTWRTQRSELDSLWTRTSEQVAMGRSNYGDLPLIVLTAGDAFGTAPEPARTAVRRLWSDLHAELAARSTRSKAVTIPRSGHMMILERPDAVVDAVTEVSQMAGRSPKPR